MASGSLASLRYVAEVTRGTTPGTPSMIELRCNTRNVTLTKRLLETQETRANRQEHDVRHGFNEVTGTTSHELAYGAQDDILTSLFGAAWASNVLKIGTSIPTFTLEKAFTDIAQYQPLRGMAVNTGTFRLNPESMVMLECGWLGMSAGAFTGTPLDASVTAAPTDEPFSVFDGSISEGGSPIATVTSLEFTINNNRQLQPVIGSKYSPDVYEGGVQVNGTVGLLFNSVALYNKFVDETESSLSVELLNIAGDKSLTIDIPRLKYNAAPIEPPRYGPIIISTQFRALYDSTAASTVVLTRDPAVA